MQQNVGTARQLGAVENLFASYCEIGSMNFAVVARVRGSVDPDDLRQAVNKVQSLHPLLSVGINNHVHPRSFVSTRNLPSVTFHSGGDWRHVAATAVAKPFDTTLGPLVRVSVVTDQHSFHLIVTLHHAVGDGMAGMFVIRDILSVLTGNCPEATASKSLDDYLGVQLDTFFNDIAEEVGEDHPAYDSAWAHRVEETPNVELLSIDPATTEKLLSVARTNGVTVHAALTCALARAWREGRQIKTNVKVFSPIDVRKYCGSTQQSGLFISAASVECTQPHLSFWEEARQAHSDLSQFRTFESAVAVSAYARAALQKDGHYSAAERFFQKHSAYDILLSNLGRNVIPATYREYKIDELWGPILRCCVRGEFVVGVTTFDRSLRATCTSLEMDQTLLCRTKEILMREMPGMA